MTNRSKTRLAALMMAALALTGCTSAVAGTSAVESAATRAITEPADNAAADAADAAGNSVNNAAAAGSLFDADELHTVAIDIPADSLADLLQTYADSGEKVWARATVTIDGTSYGDVGIKLKGNSSLRGVNASSSAETLPWRIRLDKYVDGQNVDGYTDVTIRGNSSSTSMNEAVALDLLGEAGLATEKAIETSFTVNGSAATLRLAVQNLDETWVEQNFPGAGADSVLYKSDADGDWSWRGEDGDYTTSFDVEAGPDDYAPLIELLDLVNNGSDAEKLARLPELVDLDSFATYLAFQDLVGNFDDIDGPGNNSYLFWDSATGMFTVVAWDHNLAFGASPGGRGVDAGMPPNGGGGRGGLTPPTDGVMPEGAPDGFTPPTDLPQDMTPPAGAAMPGAGGRGGFPGGMSHPLVDSFNAVDEWVAMRTAATAALTAELIDSGALDASVTHWQNLLTSSATELVDEDTISAEAEAIRTFVA